MAIKNALSLMKTVAVGSLKAPMAAGRSAVGAGAGAVTSLLGGRSAEAGSAETGPDEKSPVEKAPAPQPEPVNITEELDIDPAPVAKPMPKRSPKTTKPVTKIDAAADPSKVTVTPADVAEVVAGDAPAAKNSAG